MKNNYTISVCGHVDHGKTELIKALTAKNTMHLPEELKRGMTIDLGYSFMENENTHIDFIDLPGHKDYISNALRGLSCCDFYILVIDCNEGLMPQTFEFIRAIKALELKSGLIIINKIDLCIKERIIPLKNEIKRELDCKILSCSSKTKEGINEIKSYLFEVNIPTCNEKYFIADKTFNKQGIGKIITGTNKGYSFSLKKEVALFPQKERLYIRGIEGNNKSLSESNDYRRLALNVRDNKNISIKRGNIISEKEPIVSRIINIRILSQLKKANYNICLIIKGQKVNGRLIAFSEAYGQLRLNEPLVFFEGFTAIIIDINTYNIITGARLIEQKDYYHGKGLKYIEAIRLKERELNFLDNTKAFEKIYTSLQKEKKCKFKTKELYFKTAFEGKLFENFLLYLRTKLDYNSQRDEYYFKKRENNLYMEIDKYYMDKGFYPPLTTDMYLNFNNKNSKEEIAKLLRNKRIVAINNKYYIHIDAIEKAKKICKILFEKNKEIDTKEFRNKIEGSRKMSIMILEYLDKIKFTKNINNKRVL